MEDLTTFYFCDNADIKTYLTMVGCLSRPDIEIGFVTFSQKSRAAVLGFRMDEASDEFGCNLLNYPSIPPMINYQTPDQLDQTFDVASGLRLALMEFDFCQTKNMADLRSLITKECGIDVDNTKAFIDATPMLEAATLLPSNSSC